ncbi:Nucleosomal histone H3-Lys79 methylase [Quaeritorhiza haematococci]|nr:Nucleosomal histone H3-Lys79 methylase [Quaeritorhiza haematococci]
MKAKVHNRVLQDDAPSAARYMYVPVKRKATEEEVKESRKHRAVENGNEAAPPKPQKPREEDRDQDRDQKSESKITGENHACLCDSGWPAPGSSPKTAMGRKDSKLSLTIDDDPLEFRLCSHEREGDWRGHYRIRNPCIDAATVVRQGPGNHFLAFMPNSNQNAKLEDLVSVKLDYPCEGCSEAFPLVLPAKEGVFNSITDLRETIEVIVESCVPPKYANRFGDTKTGIMRRIIKACNRRIADDLKAAIDEFNECLREIRNMKVFSGFECKGQPAEYPFVAHILEQAYARAVGPYSHLLCKTRGFSNNVYGEVKHILVHEFIRKAGIKPHHTFLDMGSGIGNVVLQVAAECLCESYGIEIMENPSKLAIAQCNEFVSRLRYYGKPCGKIVLKQGDFLDDPEIDDVIRRADVIFVNNYIFDADLNQRILHKFLDLKENAKIISLRSFVSVDRKVNLRTSQSIESIFRVKEYYFGQDCVSWMNEGRGRWVLYKKWNFDGTQVPPEWHQWLHRVTDDAPANTPEKFVYPKFSPEHVEHLTGTTAAYKVYSTTRPKMEAWEPAVKPRE